ncbi:DNA (cytosine-5-)-methyltransferase [Rhizobiales bacterium RZME27]|uniref:DNA (cytosine-5-)-methyltransferase n=1 Tax=Endobacterium cereale TaxID=2663029 RepID=A0A6A8A8Y4_9HYPH|nr:DNA cytosine methyltransferase [Endobacterium cereale]MQY46100.1 DNA (cytosine-5-)-methyltransferase [Endobacterium cereale]
MPDTPTDTHHQDELDQHVNIGVQPGEEIVAERLGDIPAPIQNFAEQPIEEDVIRLRDIALVALKVKAEKVRATQTNAYLELLDRVRRLRELVPQRSHQLAIMHCEWSISRAEAVRLLKSSDLSEADAITYAANRVSAEMIAALVRSPALIREEANVLIEAGRILHPSDLKQMTKRRDAANPEMLRADRSRRLKRLVTMTAASQLAEFKTNLSRLVRALSLAYFRLNWANMERREAFLRQAAVRSATMLLATFDALFSDQMLSISSWDRADPADNAQSLAKVRHALVLLAQDEYLIAEITTHDYGHIELRMIAALAWLAEVDVSHLPALTEQYLIDLNYPTEADEADRYYAHDKDEMRPALTSFEICSGAGGAALGIHAAGFSSIGLVERDPYAIQTLVHNRQIGPVFFDDVKTFNYERYIGKVDLFAGGVPCQPHSTLGNRAGEADERDLFAYSVEIIKQIQPKAVVLENVSGFGNRNNAVYRARILAELHAAGYDAQMFALRAADYGLGQTRPRLVLVAMRDGLLSRFKMPPILTPVAVTLGEALYDLMAANGWTGARQWADQANRPGPTIVGGSDEARRQGFASFKQINDWLALGVRADTLADHAPTADDPVDQMPRLTLEMGAKLQGFPSRWEFQGSTTEQRRQIANAFPPILACAIGLAVREALTGEPVNYERNLSQAVIEATGHARPSQLTTSHEPAWQAAAELDLPLGDAHQKLFAQAVSSGKFQVPVHLEVKLAIANERKRERDRERRERRQRARKAG